MASYIAATLPPPLLLQGRKTLIRAFSKPPVSPIRERSTRVSVVVKATGESSESSTSLSIPKSVQSFWENSEDRPALIGLGFVAIVGLWATINLVTTIDKLPLLPGLLEVVGILFTSWFTYRYLLFKPDREELFQTCNKTISDILGQ